MLMSRVQVHHSGIVGKKLERKRYANVRCACPSFRYIVHKLSTESPYLMACISQCIVACISQCIVARGHKSTPLKTI
jgi:hypothetical protein